jgi:hypothetical protein
MRRCRDTLDKLSKPHTQNFRVLGWGVHSFVAFILFKKATLGIMRPSSVQLGGG